MTPDPRSDLSCLELWTFFCEIVAAGELESMRKQVFLRRLTGVMEGIYGLKKSHNVLRDGRAARGFKGVAIKDPNDSIDQAGLEPA